MNTQIQCVFLRWLKNYNVLPYIILFILSFMPLIAVANSVTVSLNVSGNRGLITINATADFQLDDSGPGWEQIWVYREADGATICPLTGRSISTSGTVIADCSVGPYNTTVHPDGTQVTFIAKALLYNTGGIVVEDDSKSQTITTNNAIQLTNPTPTEWRGTAVAVSVQYSFPSSYSTGSIYLEGVGIDPPIYFPSIQLSQTQETSGSVTKVIDSTKIANGSYNALITAYLNSLITTSKNINILVNNPQCKGEKQTFNVDFPYCDRSHAGILLVHWGGYGIKEYLESHAGDRLELYCLYVPGHTPEYALLYTPPPGEPIECNSKFSINGKCRVGTCPFNDGLNSGSVTVSKREGEIPSQETKPECFIATNWRSVDYEANDNPNSWTKMTDQQEANVLQTTVTPILDVAWSISSLKGVGEEGT